MMFYENQKKIHLSGERDHLLIVNGKLLMRAGKKEKNVAVMKVLDGQMRKKFRWLLVMI